MNSALLLLIENLFAVNRDAEAIAHVSKLAFDVQLEWEQASPIFRDGLAHMRWWETLFFDTYPTTSERLKRSLGRRSNATALMAGRHEHPNVWRDLLAFEANSDRIDRGVWRVSTNTMAAIQVADEFGIEPLTFISNSFQIKLSSVHGNNDDARTLQVTSPALLSHKKELVMHPVRMWPVPFQEAVIVLLQHNRTQEQELVWIPTSSQHLDRRNFELSNWSINHNNLAENPEDFAAPPFLHGDSTLTNVIVASTEGRLDIPNAKTAISSVMIRQRETLIFDQVKQDNTTTPRYWRQLLTDELWEPRGIPITSACFVLDSFLLFASNDGILRAHPRGNPNSVYHVENIHSLVPQITSLYNVVALIHSHQVLEVRRVERQDDDPFLRFDLLYRTQLADPAHAPLLYGPYVIFASLDCTWYRVKYDNASLDDKYKEPIRVPFKAGWAIEAVKTANWRYWTIVRKNTATKQLEELILFAGGGSRADGSARPFLLASCIECGTAASHLCENCLNVGFCQAHGETHEHREACIS